MRGQADWELLFSSTHAKLTPSRYGREVTPSCTGSEAGAVPSREGAGFLGTDGVGDAFLREARLGGAIEFLVGRRCVASRRRVGLAFLHEGGECSAGELLVGRLRLPGGRRGGRRLGIGATGEKAGDGNQGKPVHRNLPEARTD